MSLGRWFAFSSAGAAAHTLTKGRTSKKRKPNRRDRFGMFECLEARQVLATASGVLMSTAPSLAFDQTAALTDVKAGSGDTNGAASSNHFVSIAGGVIQWQQRSGASSAAMRIAPRAGLPGDASFFSALAPLGEVSDAVVRFDTFNNRFIVAASERLYAGPGNVENRSRILLAISATNDPFGAWKYQSIDARETVSSVETSLEGLGLAADNKAIYITANLRAIAGTNSVAARVWIFDKAGVSSGADLTVNRFDPYVNLGLSTFPVLRPASVLDAKDTDVGIYLVSAGWPQGAIDALRVIRIVNPLANVTFEQRLVNAGDTHDALAAYQGSPQPGEAASIATGDLRVTDAVWQGNNLFIVNTTIPPTGADAGQETVHWYRVNTATPGTPVMADHGAIGGEEIAPQTRTFAASIVPDRLGNMFVSFSAAGPDLLLGSYYAAHLTSQAAGVTTWPAELKQGADSYLRPNGAGVNVWTRSASIASDPANPDALLVYSAASAMHGSASLQNSAHDGRWITEWAQVSAGANSSLVQGAKWNDTDGDGIRDAGELGLAGWTVYVDLDGDGELDANEPRSVTAIDNPSTTTVDERGEYMFLGLPAGSYPLRFLPSIGWNATTPGNVPQITVGPTYLDGVVNQLAEHHTAITGLVLNRHDFTEGETGTSIADGGNDMYDGGNRLNTNLATQIPYTNGHIAAGDLTFGAGSRYFTAKYPGLFALGVSGMAVSEFFTDGVTGADSGGNVETAVFNLTVQGRAFRAVVKRTYNTGDPSIQKVIIVPGSTLSQTVSSVASSDFQRVASLDAVSEMYYLVLSRRNSIAISNEDMQQIVEAFLTLLPWDAKSGPRINFGERATTKVSGSVFYDTNQNGTFDSLESGLANWTVYADLNNNQMRDAGEPSTVTRVDDTATTGVNEAGTFALLNLPSSVFTVRTVVRDGWDTTTDSDAGLVAISSVNLQQSLATLTESAAEIVAGIDHRYDFLEGETGHEIATGGQGMYASGNRLSTNLATNFEYTDGQVVDGANVFGAGSKYFTAKFPGLFVLGAKELAIDSFNISGNTGNVGGTVDRSTISLAVAGEPYTLFIKRNYGGSGPSINQLILVRGSGTGVTQTVDSLSQNDGHTLTGLGGTRELYYLLVSREAGMLLSTADAIDMANDFLATIVQSPGIPSSITIGHYLDASISGTKWNDLDADRVRDAGEPALAGWTIYADENDNNQFDAGEPSAITRSDDPATPLVDETGTYTLVGLQEKSYHIREVPQNGWTQRYPENQEHTVNLGRPDLEGLLARLETGSTAITSLMPNRYDFTTGDSGSSISDGGDDMYDTGNRLRTNLTGTNFITYSNKVPIDTNTLFGVGSRYTTAKYPGLFVMAAGAINIDSFQISGAAGVDSVGQFDVATLPLTINGRQFTLFVKRVYGAANPSINHIIIVPGPEAGIVHTTGTIPDDDLDQIAGISHISEIYYLLFGTTAGGFVANGTMVDIASAFLNFVQPTTAAVTNIDFGNRATTETGVLRGRVFTDANRNGTREAGESGIAEITVFLDTNGNGKLDAGEPVSITENDDPVSAGVDERGVYQFVGLPAGEYLVSALATAETTFTNPLIDATGRFQLRKTLAVGEIADTVDFAARGRAPEIVVRGNGFELPNGTTSTSIAAGNAYSSIDVAGDTVAATFHIYNAGDAPLLLTGTPVISITGTAAADFSIVSVSATTIAPGEAATLIVRFDPSTTSTRTAAINIPNNDSDESNYTFRVQGSGYGAASAVANDDSYIVAEDQTLSAGFSTVVPLRASWTWFEEIARTGPTSVYPVDATPTDTWRDRGYSTSTPSFGTWKGPNNAPFAAGGIDGFSNPITTLSDEFNISGGSSRVTALFRTNFTLQAAQTTNANAVVNAICDDGCIGYINGVEIFRERMPAGPPAANSDATTAGNEVTPLTYNINLAALGVPLFADGSNVFALELHQQGTQSTDFGFDASLAISSAATGVLNNDVRSGAVTINVITQPADLVTGLPVGTLTMNSDNSGNFVFIPPRDYTGNVRFRYTITDSNFVTSAAQVAINVAAVNDAPVALPDHYSGLADRPLVVAAGRPLIEASDHAWWYDDRGTNQVAVNRTWNFGPDAAFSPGAVGWLGPARTQLGFGDGDEQTITQSTIPNAIETQYFFSKFDAPGAPSKLILETKYDDGIAISINGVSVLVDNLPANYGFNSLAVANMVDDGTVFHRFEIDTAGLDLRPTGNTIAVEVHQYTNESTDLTFDLRLYDPKSGLLANDEDRDHLPTGMSVVNVIHTLDPQTQGVLAVQPDGSFVFTPANARVNGDFAFTYVLRDANGATSLPATVLLSITATDLGTAVANDDLGVPQFITDEDTPLVIDATTGPIGLLGVGLLANDLHPGEESAPLTLVVIEPPSSGGTVVFDGGTGGFTFTPGPNYDGIDSFTYAIHDGYSLGNAATVNIIVRSVDDPPIANADGYVVTQGSAIEIDDPSEGLLANDADADGDDVGNAEVVEAPAHGVLELHANGTFRYTPVANFFGVDTFTYTVEAGGVRSLPATVTITVEGSQNCVPNGDVNGDGNVDQADLAALLHEMGGSGGTSADADCDGKVTMLDAIVVRNAMTEIEQGAAPAAVVATVSRQTSATARVAPSASTLQARRAETPRLQLTDRAILEVSQEARRATSKLAAKSAASRLFARRGSLLEDPGDTAVE